jgi:anaerobic magnesium-protoporphyrin IX monomethyl ester cyclase
VSRPIVLYNPRGEGHHLPLGLVQVGSMTPDDRVVIIDGRVELAPEARVVEHCADALCLGVSVLSGAPILDALRVSRAAKARNPRLPVIWGGWHPSLMPEQCLASEVVDACVVGQGERTIATLVAALHQGRSFAEIPGVVWKRDDEIVRNAPRPCEDMNNFRAADFGLLDLERYFRSRGVRRLDYCSSEGGPLECVDPEVHQPRWSGLDPARVVSELRGHVDRYRLDELLFSDGDFFGDLPRTEAICRGLIEAGVRARWSGAGRADPLRRLTDEQLRLMRASGCRKVTVGAEIDRATLHKEDMKAPASVDDVLEAAEKLHRAGIGARFWFVAGAPKEPKDRLARIYRTAKAIREIDGEFETPIFFYTPYPQTSLAHPMAAPSLMTPRTLEDWGRVDLDHSIGSWISEPVRRAVPRYNFYLRHGYQKPGLRLGKRLLHVVARARAKTNFYAFDFERRAVDLSKRLRAGPDQYHLRIARD